LSEAADTRLEVRRRILASPERLFNSWTTPEQLLSWWGPKDVSCTLAEMDLRVGGRYRLGNKLPDGSTLFIVGEFLTVEAPTKLVYTWSIEGREADAEQVSVLFNEDGDGTWVIIIHERIADQPTRDSHEAGWLGCLDGLVDFASMG
jgi:uncharacterized protein YndB with AHSA1/START domain